MPQRSRGKLAFILLLLLLMQFYLRPRLWDSRAAPDFILLGLLIYATRARPSPAGKDRISSSKGMIDRFRAALVSTASLPIDHSPASWIANPSWSHLGIRLLWSAPASAMWESSWMKIRS